MSLVINLNKSQEVKKTDKEHRRLVLSRRVGEKIMIDCLTEVITVEVVGLTKGQARLCIEASPGVKIFREEIYDMLNKK